MQPAPKSESRINKRPIFFLVFHNIMTCIHKWVSAKESESQPSTCVQILRVAAEHAAQEVKGGGRIRQVAVSMEGTGKNPKTLTKLLEKGDFLFF